MTRESHACLWPRAIIDVIPSRGDQAATAELLRNFDSGLIQDPTHMRLDITHLQPLMGSPYYIAQHIKRRLGKQQAGLSTTMGVASDPLVAAYAAAVARAGSIKTIAPWEVRERMGVERIESICLHAPQLAVMLKQAGVRTGAQFAEQPLQVVKRIFGDDGVALWRACRGEPNAAAFEIDNLYDAVRCRGMLPLRTSSRRSLNSHLNRICHRLVSVLRQRRRLSGNFTLAMREHKQPALEGVPIATDESELQRLLPEVKKAFFQAWNGGALQYIQLSARQLYSPGGQLDLFGIE